MLSVLCTTYSLPPPAPNTKEFFVSTYQQVVDPLWGSLGLSALCAALPLLLLFVLLGVFRVKAAKAALVSLLLPGPG